MGVWINQSQTQSEVICDVGEHNVYELLRSAIGKAGGNHHIHSFSDIVGYRKPSLQGLETSASVTSGWST